MLMNMDIINGRVLRGCSTIPPHESVDTIYLHDFESDKYIKMVVTEVSGEEACSSKIFDSLGTTAILGTFIKMNDIPKELR
jgi:hypothetical protein